MSGHEAPHSGGEEGFTLWIAALHPSGERCRSRQWVLAGSSLLIASVSISENRKKCISCVITRGKWREEMLQVGREDTEGLFQGAEREWTSGRRLGGGGGGTEGPFQVITWFDR